MFPHSSQHPNNFNGDAQSSTTDPSPPTARQKYLIRLGLTGDPFLLPNAEEEIAFSGHLLAPLTRTGPEGVEGAFVVPSFFNYYTQPFTAPDGKRLLQVLRQPGWAFVFGERGSGKTTLRLNLEAAIRRRPGHTLVVSYSFTRDIESSESYWNRLAQSLALDLFIQLVEEFNPLNPSTPEQSASWRDILILGGPTLARLAQHFLEATKPSGSFGFGDLWAPVDRSDFLRPALNYVERYQQLVDVLRSALADARGAQAPCGQAAVQAGLQLAQLWGYQHIFFLVDNFDAGERSIEAMLGLARPLLQMPAEWQPYKISGKFFLPLELKPHLPHSLLPKPAFDVTIAWDEVGLRALVESRFRAAGARYRGFDDLAGLGLEGNLDQQLIEWAKRSPRRLLEIISRLLDAHARRDPEATDRLIQLDDWQRAQKRQAGDSETPPSIPITGTDESHPDNDHEPYTQAGLAHQSAPPPDLKIV
jgi:hypothetical protein